MLGGALTFISRDITQVKRGIPSHELASRRLDWGQQSESDKILRSMFDAYPHPGHDENALKALVDTLKLAPQVDHNYESPINKDMVAVLATLGKPSQVDDVDSRSFESSLYPRIPIEFEYLNSTWRLVDDSSMISHASFPEEEQPFLKEDADRSESDVDSPISNPYFAHIDKMLDKLQDRNYLFLCPMHLTYGFCGYSLKGQKCPLAHVCRVNTCRASSAGLAHVCGAHSIIDCLGKIALNKPTCFLSLPTADLMVESRKKGCLQHRYYTDATHSEGWVHASDSIDWQDRIILSNLGKVQNAGFYPRSSDMVRALEKAEEVFGKEVP